MRRTILLLCVIAVALGGLAIGPPVLADSDDITCDFPLEVEDATGETVHIDEEPTSVVTLAPSAAQTMWEIDAADKVDGVTMHAGFLEGAGDRVNVSADPMSVDTETIVNISPDLVLAPNVTPHPEIAELRDLGLTVYHFEESQSIDDIIEKTALTGELTGACEGASETIEDMEATLGEIEESVAEFDEEPTAFYTLGDGFTPGADTFQNDAIERAGLTNIAVEAGFVGWEVMNEEIVREHDPDWIIHNDLFPEPPVSDGLSDTTAMQEDNIIVLESNKISQPGPQIVDAIEAMHNAVADEVATDEPTETPTPTDTPTPVETPTPDETPADTPTPEPDDQPGFTIAIAILGGLVLSIAAWQRHRDR